MLLVVDTNIIVSAIKSPSKYDDNGNRILTKPQMLIRDILEGKHTIVVSKAIMKEYEDVLHRPLLALKAEPTPRFLHCVTIRKESMNTNCCPFHAKCVAHMGTRTARRPYAKVHLIALYAKYGSSPTMQL